MVKQTIFGADVSIDVSSGHFLSDDQIREMEAPLGNCQHGWIESCYQKAKLHYRKWIPSSGAPKAVVIFMHGIQTHSGKNTLLPDGRKLNTALKADALLKEDYALYAFDLYGHGYSEGERMWIPVSWKNNLNDYLNFIHLVSKEQPNAPIFLMGESYGCTLSLMAAREFQDHPDQAPPAFDSIILAGPAIVGDLPPYPVVLFLRYVLAPVAPRWTPFFMPNTLTADRIWRDPDVLKERTQEPFTVLDRSGSAFRLGTAVNLLGALEHVRSRTIPGLMTPYCIIHGTLDHAVPIAGSEFLWTRSSTPDEDRVFHRLEGAFHDIFADLDAKVAMKWTLSWIKKRLAKKYSE